MKILSRITGVEIFIFVFVIALAFLSIVVPIIKCFSTGIEYSDGSRSGVVYKISKKGLFVQTWEGEMNLGFNTQNQNGMIKPEIFYFSCSSDDAAKKVQAAEKSGKRVTLKYKQYIFRGYRYGQTPYDVTDIELE